PAWPVWAAWEELRGWAQQRSSSRPLNPYPGSQAGERSASPSWGPPWGRRERPALGVRLALASPEPRQLALEEREVSERRVFQELRERLGQVKAPRASYRARTPRDRVWAPP